MGSHLIRIQAERPQTLQAKNMLIKKRSTDKALTRRLIDQINRRLPELVSGEQYALEDIVGPEYWLDEDENDSHLALGRAFSLLVAAGRTTFVEAAWTSNRHNNYRYIK
jgi:hypothetical protein